MKKFALDDVFEMTYVSDLLCYNNTQCYLSYVGL